MCGNTRAEGKILSLFEPSTEVIRKGKAGKPNEFGKMVKLQEAENQIVIDYEVYDQRPSDSDLLDRGHRNPPSQAGTRAAPGGGGRRIIAREFTGRWRHTFIEASVVTRRIHDLAADDGEVGSDHAARSPWRFAAHVVGRLSGSFTQLPLSPVQDRAALLKI
jgi:hypothetical protein